MWKEFKTFIMRGNVLDLAVGVVIGGAFTAIVNSLVVCVNLFYAKFRNLTCTAYLEMF